MKHIPHTAMFTVIKVKSLMKCLKINKFTNQIPIIIPAPIKGSDINLMYSLKLMRTIDNDSDSETINPMKHPLVTATETPVIPECNKRIIKVQRMNP